MNWSKIKSFLNNLFFPGSVMVEEMMKEIREASDKFKKELREEADLLKEFELATKMIVYHYCAKQGFNWQSGYVAICISERDPLTNKNVPISFETKIQAIRENIAWQTMFDPNRMVIVSLNEIHSI